MSATAVMVAKAKIEGRPVVLVREKIPTVEIKKGAELVVEVEYSLDETSPAKEEYTFRLDCNVGKLSSPDSPKAMPTVGVRHDDKRGAHDRESGKLRQKVAFPDAGDFAIGFNIEAEYTRLPWGENQISSQDRSVGGGRIYVKVV